MDSHNMNYRYNVEYYDGLKASGDKFTVVGDTMSKRTHDIVNFPFPADETFLPEIEQMDEVLYFDLCTAYPGLMIGTGALHEISMDDTLKNGFTFDYVTGLPYLPGSSLKGILRSYFPEKGKDDQESKAEYIKSFFPNKNFDIIDFTKWAFGNEDNVGQGTFIGAFPVFMGQKKLLSMEYITPHKDSFTNPVPISMLKVKPNVKFRFVVCFDDYKVEDDVILSSEEIKNLFKQVILDMGIGAKTNVGFGVMTEKEVHENIVASKPVVKATGRGGNYNEVKSPTGDVVTCKACKKNYKTTFKGQPVTECPFCHGKGNKKNNGNKGNWR